MTQVDRSVLVDRKCPPAGLNALINCLAHLNSKLLTRLDGLHIIASNPIILHHGSWHLCNSTLLILTVLKQWIDIVTDRYIWKYQLSHDIYRNSAWLIIESGIKKCKEYIVWKHLIPPVFRATHDDDDLCIGTYQVRLKKCETIAHAGRCYLTISMQAYCM